MGVNIYSIDRDEVVDSLFLTGKTDYDYALKEFVPLVDRLDIQRKGQSPKFYNRLENDLLNGCIMPPITIAFVGLEIDSTKGIDEIGKAIEKNINDGFILDGLQRMRTIQRASQREDITLDLKRPMFLNILLCDSMDKLLYRMITLNNGQKPMTARHQIEIIASNIYNFDQLSLPIQTEKERATKRVVGAFNKADFIKAYLAFLSQSTNIDNSRIIEEKMDELIADKILQTDIKSKDVEFTEIVDLIEKFTASNLLNKRWFKNINNLIGFCSSVAESYEYIKSYDENLIKVQIDRLEEAFGYFDVSKIKVGTARRNVVSTFFAKFERLKDVEITELVDEFSVIV